MKKRSLLSLAMMGITAGFLVTSCQTVGGDTLTRDMQTFYNQLTPDAQKKFMELDENHRRMAMEVVEQYCKADHECQGVREKAVEDQYRNQLEDRSPDGSRPDRH